VVRGRKCGSSISMTACPFDIGGQKFTVMLHKKPRAGGIDPDSQQTLARVEIRDASGRLHFNRTLPFQLSGAEFQYTGRRHRVRFFREGKIPTAADLRHFAVRRRSAVNMQVFAFSTARARALQQACMVDGELMLEKQQTMSQDRQ